MNDVALLKLVSSVPEHAIIVIEDIDCIFPPIGIFRDEDKNVLLDPNGLPLVDSHERESRVTLSGMLNILDGVGSDDGRIIFATVRLQSPLGLFLAVWKLIVLKDKPLGDSRPRFDARRTF